MIHFLSDDCRIKGDIILGMKRTTSASHKCCYPTCSTNMDLRRISKFLQYYVLKELNFFVLDGTKVCTNHANTETWEQVNDNAQCSVFRKEHIVRIIEILRSPKPEWEQNASGNNFFRFHLCF